MMPKYCDVNTVVIVAFKTKFDLLFRKGIYRDTFIPRTSIFAIEIRVIVQLL